MKFRKGLMKILAVLAVTVFATMLMTVSVFAVGEDGKADENYDNDSVAGVGDVSCTPNTQTCDSWKLYSGWMAHREGENNTNS